jgi:hypothetical protein
MRIHTNLTRAEIHTLTYGINGVDIEAMERGSRSRPRAFDVHLLAVAREGRRRGNTGHYGAGYDYAATWDEWGIVFARLFALDPDANCYAYHGAADYHFKTAQRFARFGKLVELDPGRWVFPEVGQVSFNAHDQHRWTYVGPYDEITWEYECTGRLPDSLYTCGAIKRFVHKETVTA